MVTGFWARPSKPGSVRYFICCTAVVTMYIFKFDIWFDAFEPMFAVGIAGGSPIVTVLATSKLTTVPTTTVKENNFKYNVSLSL